MIPSTELVSNFNSMFVINSPLPCNQIYLLLPRLEHWFFEKNCPAYHANWQASCLACYQILTLLDFPRANMLNILIEIISGLSVNLPKQFLLLTDTSVVALDEVGIWPPWVWVYYAVFEFNIRQMFPNWFVGSWAGDVTQPTEDPPRMHKALGPRHHTV